MSDMLTMSLGGKSFRLGYSRINAFLECPKKFKYSYIDNLRGKPTPAILKGNAYHNTLEVLLNYKVDREKLLKLHKAEGLGLMYAAQESLSATDRETVRVGVNHWYSARYVNARPLVVEGDFKFEKFGIRFTGRLDLIETNGWITDHKLSFDLWQDARAKVGSQPIVYYWAAKEQLEKKYGFKLKGFCYDVVRTFPTPILQHIRISAATLERVSPWYEEEIPAVARLMLAGAYPANPHADSCKRCFHKKLCNPGIYRLDVTTVGYRDPLDED